MQLDVEHILELLDTKLVRTSQGSYISVDDLKQLEQEFKEAKGAEKPTGSAKTLAAARRAIKQDPEILAAFGEKDPRAPADANVVKPVAEGEQNAA